MTAFQVSVVMPVYNAATFVEKAVQSAVDIPEVGEVLLVDDGSADNSLAVCFELAQKYRKVKVLQHADKKNHGAAASRNLGIVNAGCDFVAFLDADDYYLPHRFKMGKEIFTRSPEIDGVFGCCMNTFVSEKARELFYKVRDHEVMTFDEGSDFRQLYKYLLYGGAGEFHTSAITLRKSAFQKAGLFNERIRYVEDTELWVKLSLLCQLYPGSIHEPISVRVVHESNSIHELSKIQPYRELLFKELFDWAMKQPFSFEVKNDFFNVFCRYTKGQNYPVKIFFWEQIRRRTTLLFSSFFLKKLYLMYINN